MLASLLPISSFVAAGTDVTPPPLPAGAPWWAQYAVVAAPALGLWCFSVAVARLNGFIRARDAAGIPVMDHLRLIAAILNLLAGNPDKTVEQAAIAKGTTAPRPSDPTAGAPEVKP